MKTEIAGLVNDFVAQLANVICSEIMGGTKALERDAAVARTGRRRKPPVQLCPVPKCKNRAAPVFGMVCREHKNVAKAKVRRYRELRREAAAAAR